MRSSCLRLPVFFLRETTNLENRILISVKIDDVRYPGDAVGQQHFIDQSIRKHVEKWTDEMESLSHIATAQPHAAYSSFIHRAKSKWHYHMRSHPGTSLQTYQDLDWDRILDRDLLPALTGRPMPVRFGGIAIPRAADESIRQCESSVIVLASVVAMTAANGDACGVQAASALFARPVVGMDGHISSGSPPAEYVPDSPASSFVTDLLQKLTRVKSLKQSERFNS